MNTKRNFQLKNWAVPIAITATFFGIGMWGYVSSGYIQAILFFGYIGIAAGLGLGLYQSLPKRKKSIGRRVSLGLVGLFLLGDAILLGSENVQIEGAMFGLLTGVIQMGVVHYMIAKIFGPLLFGRMWCGWACWTVMVLDLLPFTRPSGRLPQKYGWLRYLHLAISITVVIVLIYVFRFTEGATGTIAVTWFIIGNLLYYASGIILAYALKDNRAFCKYLCPVSVPLKVTSRFSVIKIGGDAEKCNDCNACVKMCPMDIRIPEYIKNGERVASTECILCQTCVTVCAHDVLKLSFGLDVGGKELLRERVPVQKVNQNEIQTV